MAERDAVEQESETAAREGEDRPGASQSRASVDPLQVAREAFTSEEPDELGEAGQARRRTGREKDGSKKDGSGGSSLRRRLLTRLKPSTGKDKRSDEPAAPPPEENSPETADEGC